MHGTTKFLLLDERAKNPAKRLLGHQGWQLKIGRLNERERERERQKGKERERDSNDTCQNKNFNRMNDESFFALLMEPVVRLPC